MQCTMVQGGDAKAETVTVGGVGAECNGESHFMHGCVLLVAAARYATYIVM